MKFQVHCIIFHFLRIFLSSLPEFMFIAHMDMVINTFHVVHILMRSLFFRVKEDGLLVDSIRAQVAAYLRYDPIVSIVLLSEKRRKK